MKLDDLVVLEYATNNCYVHVKEVKDIKDQDLTIDLDNQKWSYREWKDVKIGSSRNIFDRHSTKGGIIGVYDRNNTQHLNMLAYAAIEFTQDDPPFDE